MSLVGEKHYLSNSTHKQFITTLYLVMILLLPTLLWSQRWFEDSKQYTVDDGLPTLDIYHAIQDQEGYLWIATDVGIARFDGYEFEVLTMRDGLSNNNILRLEEGESGNIFLNSIGPLSVLENGVPRILDLPELRGPKYSYDLASSAEGGLWLNHGYRILYLGPDMEPRPLPTPIATPEYQSPRIIQKTENDTVLIYSGTQLYFTYNDQLLDSLSLPGPLCNANYLCYKYTSAGVYFVNTEGLQFWSFLDNEIRVLDDEVDIGMELDIEGNQLFLLHSNYGLRIYDIDGNEVHISQKFSPSDYCLSYLLDFEGNLWIVTLGDGIFFYPQQQIQSDAIPLPEGQRRISKLAIYENQLYLGTYEGQIYTFESEARSAEYWTPSIGREDAIFDRITDIVHSPETGLLVGKDSGIYHLSGDSLQRISSLTVKDLCLNPDLGLTISTQHGCLYLNKSQLDYRLNIPQNDENWVEKNATAITDTRGYSSHIAMDGTIWVYSTEEGLISYNSGVSKPWKKQSSVFSVHINDMLELPDSTMVFATHGEGLILLKNGDFWVIDQVEQLPSNIVNALYTENGNLWVGTNRGVAQLMEIDRERRYFQINVYNRNDGLLTENVSDLVVWNNQVLLGTRSGLLRLPLQQEPHQEVYPRIVLNRAEANGDQLDLNEQSKLQHNQNNISFQFFGISFRSKGKIRYRYRLKGYDQDWASTASREMTYHNLSPGEYTFEVHAIDYKGLVSTQPATISFSITPHFTQRVIFWIFVVLASIGLLFGGVHSYLSIRERNVLSKLVAEKTASLDRRVVELARSNEELEQFAHAASHDLRSPLRNVASFVQLLDRKAKERLLEEEREYIDLAIRGVKGMEQTIDDLLKVARIDQYNENKERLNFATIVEEIKEANLNLIQEQDASIILETGFPDLFFSKVNALQLLQNLIINGITYRSEDPPIIRLACRDNGLEWIFSIADNGIGIAPEFQQKIFGLFHRLHHPKDIPGTGIGLAICKKIVERNGGKMSVRSETGKGATFFFSIPKQ